MNDEKRMAGDYEIIQSIHIGDREVVFGENKNSEPDARYLCGYCVTNELFQQYEDCMVGDDYLEIMGLFTGRVNEQMDMVKAEREEVIVPMEVITAEQCYPNDLGESINGKVVAVRADVLRREYQTADRQIALVTGGFGANANSRGSAVFCTNLYHGKHTRWERRDIQGEVKPEHIPAWAKERLAAIQAEKGTAQPNRDKKDKGAAR